MWEEPVMSPATITKLEALREKLSVTIEEDRAKIESVRAIVAMCDKMGETVIFGEDSAPPIHLNNVLREFEKRLCCQMELLNFLESAM